MVNSVKKKTQTTERRKLLFADYPKSRIFLISDLESYETPKIPTPT